VSVHVRGGRYERTAAEPQRHTERLGNGFGDLGLDGEDALELAVVGLRPHAEAVRDVHELGADTDLIAVLSHAAAQQIRHAQLLPDLA
jgi:hypothetical protein